MSPGDKQYERMFSIHELSKTASYQSAKELCYSHSNGHLAVPDSKYKEDEILATAQSLMYSQDIKEATLMFGKDNFAIYLQTLGQSGQSNAISKLAYFFEGLKRNKNGSWMAENGAPLGKYLNWNAR